MATLQSHISDLATRIANYLRDSVTPRLIPTGGTTGQVLAKTSANAYDVSWITAATGGAAADPFPLATEVTTDLPSGGAPATGIKLFAALRAGRRLPGYVSASGRSERLQPFIGANEIMLVDVPAGGTLYNTLGTAMATDVGTATTPTITTTNILTMQPRRVLSVAATVNLMMEARAAAPWCSRYTVGGGFHFTCRFGLETVLPATGRLFAGLTASTAALTGADPLGTLVNAVGIAKNSASSTLVLMSSPTIAGNGTSVALPNTGAVGWNVAGTMFQLELFCTAGGITIGYRVTRWTPNGTNAPTITIDDGTLSDSLTLPLVSALFVPHIWAQNVAATATSLAVIQMYKESD